MLKYCTFETLQMLLLKARIFITMLVRNGNNGVRVWFFCYHFHMQKQKQTFNC